MRLYLLPGDAGHDNVAGNASMGDTIAVPVQPRSMAGVAYPLRGAQRMTAAPAREMAAPITSQ